MELDQTFPPTASPAPTTGGEDSCILEVTDMAIDGLTLLICLCGLVGNGVVLWFLGCRIRRNPITIYILNLAVTDFAFLLFLVISSLLYLIDNSSCYPVGILKYQRWLFLLLLFSYNMGLYLLTAISIERCVSILRSGIRHPKRSSVVVCALLWVLSIAVTAPVTALCLMKYEEHCQTALISMYVLNFLILAPPMVISNVILFAKVVCGSQQRQPKRFYIVIFLTVLFFLLFALPLSIRNSMEQLGYRFLSSQAVFLLASINSSINPFIYFLVGSCRRHCSVVSLQVAFQRVFEEVEDHTTGSNDTTMGTLTPAC
ncbi:PREDICTED: mas-related G-protein coupled receptor member H-like [Calidris pugnax]|uniref:mas-related G-protein coupled receptor member H-like n=1 Tax=Calidris pugnax TaxID=198806 RepID=UPI00071E5DF0|nr:PREDICTED: mas-related G-protein coupled receptor member H-like [Calidris pugnax]